MKKYFLLIGLSVFCLEIKAQESKIESVKFETGIQVPLGNLATKYELSEEFGVYYRTKLPFNDILDLGVKFYFPNVKYDFTYYAKDSTYSTKVKDINFTILGKVNKHYNFKLLKKDFVLEWTSGFGFNFLMFTDKEKLATKPTWETDENGDNVWNLNSDAKSLTSFYFSQGIGINRNRLGVSAYYNFIPYNWFTKRIEKNFGNSSLSFALTYKI